MKLLRTNRSVRHKRRRHEQLPLALILAVAGCGEAEGPVQPGPRGPSGPGSLRVQVSTSGVRLDPDGYRVILDDSDTIAVAPTGLVTFANVAAGDHTVKLDDVRRGCVTPYAAAQRVSVASASTTPIAIEVACGYLVYTANLDRDEVVVLTSADHSIVDAIAVGRNPVGIAFTPDGSIAYVANVWMADPVSVIDVATSTVMSEVSIGNGTFDVAVRRDGAAAYVVNFWGQSSSRPPPGPGHVSVVETATHTVQATITVASDPQGVAISPSGDLGYVTEIGQQPVIPDSVAVVDLSSNAVTARIAVGLVPGGLAVSPDGSRVYVANRFSEDVSVISTASHSVIATIPVGEFTAGEMPVDLAITPDGSFVYVAKRDAARVSVIETASNTLIGSILTGGSPVDLSITPDGRHVYIANGGGVVVIEVASNSVVATISLEGSTAAVAVSPG